jgi:hypothetical protein
MEANWKTGLATHDWITGPVFVIKMKYNNVGRYIELYQMQSIAERNFFC